jgi:hypothetical protein
MSNDLFEKYKAQLGNRVPATGLFFTDDSFKALRIVAPTIAKEFNDMMDFMESKVVGTGSFVSHKAMYMLKLPAHRSRGFLVLQGY